MESRFEIVSEERNEELKEKCENENTKNNTEWWKNVFKKWRNKRLEGYENDGLDLRLSLFQLSIHKGRNFARYVINKWN